MKHEEAVSFIMKAITNGAAQNWADLGCGSGTFTKALAGLLPQGSKIIAIDREFQRFNTAGIGFLQANFERDDLHLQNIDGMMLANSIHYVADKTRLIRKLETAFANSARFLIIEYDTDQPNPWVPYPVSFENLRNLFTQLDYSRVVKLNERASAYRSGMMYCALVEQ